MVGFHIVSPKRFNNIHPKSVAPSTWGPLARNGDRSVFHKVAAVLKQDHRILGGHKVAWYQRKSDERHNPYTFKIKRRMLSMTVSDGWRRSTAGLCCRFLPLLNQAFKLSTIVTGPIERRKKVALQSDPLRRNRRN
jgi:hypothetical protein